MPCFQRNNKGGGPAIPARRGRRFAKVGNTAPWQMIQWKAVVQAATRAAAHIRTVQPMSIASPANSARRTSATKERTLRFGDANHALLRRAVFAPNSGGVLNARTVSQAVVRLYPVVASIRNARRETIARVVTFACSSKQVCRNLNVPTGPVSPAPQLEVAFANRRGYANWPIMASIGRAHQRRAAMLTSSVFRTSIAWTATSVPHIVTAYLLHNKPIGPADIAQQAVGGIANVASFARWQKME